MRILILAVALMLLPALSAHAQAIGTCAPQYVGSPSYPYQWVGATSVAYTGNGNGIGLLGMSTQCRADFGPGARMCSSAEILDSDTLNPSALGTACWVRPTYQPGYQGVADLSGANPENGSGDLGAYACSGWTRSDSGLWGLTLTANGGVGPGRCDIAKPVACCKPIAVGGP